MRYLLIFVVTCLSMTNIAVSQAGDGTPALAKLQELTGNWEGTFEWSGARSASGKMNATYYSTGNGSAIVENLTVDGAPIMTSVYHLDGTNLRMTHFCAAQNQPRLKASLVDLAQGVIKFSLVDVTNLRSPEAGYVHGLKFDCWIQITSRLISFSKVAGSKASNELTLSVLPTSWVSSLPGRRPRGPKKWEAISGERDVSPSQPSAWRQGGVLSAAYNAHSGFQLLLFIPGKSQL